MSIERRYAYIKRTQRRLWAFAWPEFGLLAGLTVWVMPGPGRALP